MFEWSQILIFSLATIALAITPGPAVFYIITRSLQMGSRAGLVSVAGVAAGGVVHVIGAVLGLGGILASSATLFEIVRFAGAGYLVFLGLQQIWSYTRSRQQSETSSEQKPVASTSLSKLFRQGLIVEALNPKVAIFFVSFLPQFVNIEKGQVPLQMFILGMLFVTIMFMCDSLVAMLSSLMLRDKIKKVGQRFKKAHWYSGGLYIGLGIFTAAWNGK